MQQVTSVSINLFRKHNKVRLFWLWLFVGGYGMAFAQSVEIWQIQGSGLVSPYVGQTVTTQANIVTAVGDDFFFMQTPDARADADVLTSEGILVYTGTAPGLAVGNHVNVTGTVDEFAGTTELTFPNLSWTLTTAGDAVASAVALTATFPGTDAGPLPDLERVEGMRVTFTAQVCGPSSNGGTAILTTRPLRPFREPGIEYPGQASLPEWDGNPERIYFDPDALGAPNNRFLSFGMTVECTDGVIQQDNGRYFALPRTYEVTGAPNVVPVRTPLSGEVTVGNINALFFGLEGNDTERARKLALYITQSLQRPDIVAMQEVGSLSILQELVFTIQQLSPGVAYVPYYQSSSGSINNAYLVRSDWPAPSVSQLGTGDLLSIGGVLHDRPPLLLEIDLPTQPTTRLRVLNLHLRSLIGITGSNATFVRTKRHEQAISVANMVEDLRDENLVVLGDFNAFQFTDGYVDVTNQISGQPSAGALYDNLPIVSPPLDVLTAEALPTDERYSYVFNGNAQLIDHCLTNDFADITVADLEFARGNADVALAYAENEFLVHRTSDHDGFVLFLQPDFPLGQDQQLSAADVLLFYANPLQSSRTINVVSQVGPVQLRLLDSQGRLVQQYGAVENGASIVLPDHLPQGGYILQVKTAGRMRSEWVVIP